MKAKRKYIPANIRAGVKIDQAIEWSKNKLGPFKIEIISYKNGHDINGNGTAHYICTLVSNSGSELTIVESGGKREQVGYSGMNEAAMYALKELGFVIDKSVHGNYDYQGTKFYNVLNMRGL